MSPYTITNLCKTISVISLLSLQVTATAQINFGDNYITPGIYSSVAAGGGNYNDGPESLIGGGDSNRNQTNAPYSFIGGGFYNANLNLGATIVGGAYNTNVGYLATIGGGTFNTANGTNSTIPGGRGAVASLYGQLAHASGSFARSGDAQASTYLLRAVTTSATQTELFLDGAGQRLVIPTNSSWLCEVEMFCRRTTKHNGHFGIIVHDRFLAENQSGTILFFYPKYNAYEDLDPFASSSGYDISFTEDSTLSLAGPIADNTHQAIVFKATGPSSETVRWLARVRTVELIGP